MTTRPQKPPHDEHGAALLMALLISIAIAAMALGAIMLASSAQLTTTMTAREATMQAAANGGLEIVRDSINRGTFDSLLPDSGFTTLASNAPVNDAFGNPLPGLTQSLYVGRTGGRTGGAATAGQYGSNFASALAVVTDIRGNSAVRRMLLTQESWAKYAIAINNWSSAAQYGCTETFAGPVFSNDVLKLQPCSPQAILFRGPVGVVGSISNQPSGDFTQGVTIGATPIPWPTAAKIATMRQYAQDGDAANGDYDLTSPNATLGTANPALHIEFIPVDVNGDGVIGWDEGFMRVWVANSNCAAGLADTVCAYATARRWPTGPGGGAASVGDPNMVSRNCGAQTSIGGGPIQFFDASDIYNGVGGGAATVQAQLSAGTLRRCFLGGDPHLFPLTGDTLTPDSTVTDSPTFPFGWWKKRRSGAWPALASVRPGDKSYLIPLGANPNFKGVIFVTGDVAISGSLRGRVSVVATGNVVLADDLLYNTVPGSECDAQGDMLGVIATQNVVIEDNNLQTPFAVNSTVYGGFDDTNDANYDAFFLALGNGTSGLGNIAAEDILPPFSIPVPYLSTTLTGSSTPYAASPSAIAQRSSGGQAANGYFRVTGGLAVGRIDGGTSFGGNYGWTEAYTYDPCGAVNPPPYFPTTGRFITNRYYEIDPVWLRQLTVAQYFKQLQSQ